MRDINTGNVFWQNGAPTSGLPTDETEYDDAASIISGYDWAFIDLEHWPNSKIWSPPETTYEQIYQAWANFRTLWQEIKDRTPNVKLGYWGNVGVPTMTSPVSSGFSTIYPEYLDHGWGEHATGLLQLLDFYALPQYYYGQDLAHFTQKIKAEVAMCRAFGDMPVFTFIWHRRVDTFNEGENDNDSTLIPSALWDGIIDVSLQYADGICFWQHPFETITPTAQLRLNAVANALG